MKEGAEYKRHLEESHERIRLIEEDNYKLIKKIENVQKENEIHVKNEFDNHSYKEKVNKNVIEGIELFNIYLNKLKNQSDNSQTTDIIRKHMRELEILDKNIDLVNLVNHVIEEINFWYDYVFFIDISTINYEKKQNIRKIKDCLNKIEQNILDYEREHKGHDSYTKLSTIINDIGFNVNTLKSYLMKEDKELFDKINNSFESKIRSLLINNNILKESFSDKDTIIFVLDDFLNKNRENFNQMDSKNKSLEKHIKDIEIHNGKLIEQIKYIEKENFNNEIKTHQFLDKYYNVKDINIKVDTNLKSRSKSPSRFNVMN